VKQKINKAHHNQGDMVSMQFFPIFVEKKLHFSQKTNVMIYFFQKLCSSSLSKKTQFFEKPCAQKIA
jgi:hypothetical protein